MESVMKGLMRERVSTDGMQFTFRSDREDKYIAKKKELY